MSSPINTMDSISTTFEVDELPPKQTGAANWHGPDMLRRKHEWNINLTAAEIDELILAAKSWLKSHQHLADKDLAIAFPAEFPLPTLAPRLAKTVKELMHGRGFVVFSGLPVATLSERECAVIFSGLASHMGALRPQDARGSLVGHVRDQGLSSDDPNVRIYQTRERQGFHADWADVVGLLCLRPAKSGGTSMLVSSYAIFNAMQATRPDLAAALMQPLASDRRGEFSLGEKPYDMIPVFSYHGGYLTTLTHRVYINSAQRFEGAPRLTPAQVEALDMFDELANSPEMSFCMRLQPGDMQFVYNHSLLHDRTAYEDDSAARRHLMRVWLALPSDRPLPECYASRYGSIEVGNRGGVWVMSNDEQNTAENTPVARKAAGAAA